MTRTLSKTTARRLAITRQRLSGSMSPATADGIMEVVRDLGCVQLDPISVVVRSPLLVLWSRLGVYDPFLLDKLLYEDRLVGRIDPAYDRKTRTLNINHIYAEPDAPAGAAPQIRAAIESLAQFVGAQQINYGEVAEVWEDQIAAALPSAKKRKASTQRRKERRKGIKD